MSVEFLITTLVVVAIPGTGALYTIAAGLARGTRASVVAAVACTLGIVPHMVAALTGLAAILYASSVAFQVVKYLGVAYLLYMAYRTWRDRSDLVADADATPRSPWRVIGQGILINVLNPKLTVFFFAFLPQFVHPDEDFALLHLVGLSSIFMAATFVVFAGYGIFAAAMRRHVLQRPRVVTWMRRGFAAAYVGLAARLAIPER